MERRTYECWKDGARYPRNNCGADAHPHSVGRVGVRVALLWCRNNGIRPLIGVPEGYLRLEGDRGLQLLLFTELPKFAEKAYSR